MDTPNAQFSALPSLKGPLSTQTANEILVDLQLSRRNEPRFSSHLQCIGLSHQGHLDRPAAQTPNQDSDGC